MSKMLHLPAHVWSPDAVAWFSLAPSSCQSHAHHVVDNNRSGLVGAVVDCQS